MKKVSSRGYHGWTVLLAPRCTGVSLFVDDVSQLAVAVHIHVYLILCGGNDHLSYLRVAEQHLVKISYARHKTISFLFFCAAQVCCRPILCISLIKAMRYHPVYVKIHLIGYFIIY